MGLRLNLGCGPSRLDGEIGVDLDPGAAACDVAANLLALPFADGSVEQARLSHVLEHFPYRLAPTVLLEVARVLAPGGRIVVGVPDMLGTCRAWVETHETADATSAERLSSKQIVMRHVYGGQFHDGQEHLSGWDEEMLTDLLDACGFARITVRMDVERGDVIDSLLAEAVKPGWEVCSTCGNTGWAIDVERAEDAVAGDAIPVTDEPCPDCPTGDCSRGMLRARAEAVGP